MIWYEDAKKILKTQAQLLTCGESEEVAIEDSVGRILAEDIFCQENNPPFDNSAMDGFALSHEFLQKSESWLHKWHAVHALVAAGETDVVAADCDIIEIMTGAQIPSGFDAVVRIEDVEVSNLSGARQIRLQTIPEVSSNIRYAGEDSKVGDLLLKTGTELNAQHLLIFATQGISRVKVAKRIKFGVVATGRELMDFDVPELRPGQIRNSTSVYLRSVLNSQLAENTYYGVVEDHVDNYLKVVCRMLDDDVDVIVSTGAVSAGVFDFVKPALEKLGAQVHFHKCAIRPGKPVLFGSMEFLDKTKFFFGMPGNPVSTVVGYNFFIQPFIRFFYGLEDRLPISAKLQSDVKKPDGLRCFLKADLKFEKNENRVVCLEGQASFMVSSFRDANSWMILSESGSMVEQGTEVEVYSL